MTTTLRKSWKVTATMTSATTNKNNDDNQQEQQQQRQQQHPCWQRCCTSLKTAMGLVLELTVKTSNSQQFQDARGSGASKPANGRSALTAEQRPHGEAFTEVQQLPKVHRAFLKLEAFVPMGFTH
eukprot:2190822-Amphidinium_carterae.2